MTPQELLDERYAKGELTREQYNADERRYKTEDNRIVLENDLIRILDGKKIIEIPLADVIAVKLSSKKPGIDGCLQINHKNAGWSGEPTIKIKHKEYNEAFKALADEIRVRYEAHRMIAFENNLITVYDEKRKLILKSWWLM